MVAHLYHQLQKQSICVLLHHLPRFSLLLGSKAYYQQVVIHTTAAADHHILLVATITSIPSVRTDWPIVNMPEAVAVHKVINIVIARMAVNMDFIITNSHPIDMDYFLILDHHSIPIVVGPHTNHQVDHKDPNA